MVILNRLTCKVLQVRYNKDMTPAKRIIKRAIIILVYIVIIFAVWTALYYLFRAKPTCNDGKKNQGEENIDCGGPCQKCREIPEIEAIITQEKEIVQAGQNRYDALVKIQNPNSLFGVASLEYTFDFLDGAGKIVSSQEGSSFILPAEAKYIFAFNAVSDQKPESLNFRIKSLQWQKFLDYEEPDIPVSQKEFSFVSSGSGFAQLKAKIRNQSKYDFRQITTRVVLRDMAGTPVAINETNNNNVTANEEREIIFNWNEPFSKDIDVQKIEVDPEVNVFSDDNFMKKYGSPEQYRSYGP